MRIIIEIDERGDVTATREPAVARAQPESEPPVEALGDLVDAGPPVPPASLDEELTHRAIAEDAARPGGPAAEDTGGPPELEPEEG